MIRLQSKYAVAASSCGFVYFRLGQLGQASANCGAALDIDRRDADALYLLGLIARAQGRQAEGATDLGLAKAVNPKMADKSASYGVR